MFKLTADWEYHKNRNIIIVGFLSSATHNLLLVKSRIDLIKSDIEEFNSLVVLITKINYGMRVKVIRSGKNVAYSGCW